MKHKFLRIWFLILVVLAANSSFAQAVNNRGVTVKDEGTILGFVRNIDFVGSVVSCSVSGPDATCTWTTPLLPSNNLSDLTNATTARTNLGLTLGVDVQPYNADLATIASLGVTNALPSITDPEICR